MQKMRNAECRLGQIALFLLGMLLAACGLFGSKTDAPPRMETRSILFKCDRDINHGMLLPVEVIYITTDDSLKEVMEIGPDAWFDSKQRESWAHRQTVSLRSGIDARLILNKPPQTKYIVIFASYFRNEDPEAQQIVLSPDAETEAPAEEVVWVGAASLYH